MVTVNEGDTKKKITQVTAIPAIMKRLENYKDLPFIEKLPFVIDFILDNKFKEYIQKIYLYGSYAYGEPNKYSDIDFHIEGKYILTSKKFSVKKKYILMIY